MDRFTIVLKNEKLRFYHRLSWFIVAILTLIYTYLAFFAKNHPLYSKGIAFFILMAIVIGLKIYFEKTKYNFGSPFFYFILIGALVASEQYILTGVVVIFDTLYMISVRIKKVYFSLNEIRYPSFPAKHIKWQSLNNCLLKDGLLTIDLKNNKIIQQLIDETATTIDEKEFNEFCRQQLEKWA